MPAPSCPWPVGATPSSDLPESPDDGRFHVGCRHARDRAGVLPSTLKQGCGHVITIPRRALLARARGHAIAAVIEDSAEDDTITLIDLSASPPKIVGELKAPSSVVGPPQNVAIA